jgi:UDP-glucose 4-epimerase
MKNKKVVVTGGAGFIGSNIVSRLCSDNSVVVVDNLSTGRRENIAELIESDTIDFVEGSITDVDLLHEVFAGAEYVFHQAAVPSVPRSVKDPVTSNEHNVNGTLNVLVAARDAQVKKVVYASSSSVYGDTPELPKREDMQLAPLSPYAVTKLAGEYYCNVFQKLYGLGTASLRYFNVFGPRQDPNGAYAAVIPRFINMVLQGESPVIFGDGLQTRDFSFVSDVVAANIGVAESQATGEFNIAGGNRLSLNELTDIIILLGGSSIEKQYADPRPGDVMHSVADLSKARAAFGFNPHYLVKDGLKETFQWFRKQAEDL